MAISKDSDDMVDPGQADAPDLDAWRAEAGAALEVADAATEPPWEAAEEIVLYVAPGADPTPPWNIPAIVDDNGGMQEDDARFIAAARTGWPRDAARVAVLADLLTATRANARTLLDASVEAMRFANKAEDRIAALEYALREACEGWDRARKSATPPRRADAETIARLRALAAGTAAAAGEEPTR